MDDVRVLLGRTGLQVFPLTLGTDVFGWTADEQASFAVLDAYAEAGGNILDTADVYNAWAPGNSGGEAETILGRWFARRGNRDDIVLASKVSQHPDFRGLSPEVVRRAADASLARLGTDRIDLYYAHYDDPAVPLDETVGALSALVDEGKVRHLAASNYPAERLRGWLDVVETRHYHPLAAYQPHYNLLERAFERAEGPVAAAAGLAVLPYSALAGGFLTGKYRDGKAADSGRTDGTSPYADPRGRAVLAVVDEVAGAHHTSPTAVAIAWLRHQPTVVAPITSARRAGQLPDLLDGATLVLTPDEIDALSAASAGPSVHAAG